jgi:glycosyltransferase involved in cell wall biosynthesis
MLGTSALTKGGIAAVLSTFAHTGLFERWPVIHIVTHQDGTRRHKAGVVFSALLTYIRLLICRRITLVHAHSASDASFWRKALFILLAFATKVPVIFHLHGGGFMDFYNRPGGTMRRWLIRYVLNHSAAVVVLTEEWRRWLSNITTNKNMMTIANPVNSVDLFQIDRTDLSGAVVLFLGRLDKEKGIYELVEAATGVCREFPKAVVRFGGIGETEGIKQHAAATGISDRVEVLGWLSGTEKLDALRTATIYVLPSFAEGLPMGILEAMAAGLPIVASRVGGIPDVVEDGLHGILVEAGNVAELTEALLKLLRDPALCARMGAAGRRRVAEKYLPERIIPQIEELYRQVLDADVERAT